MERYFLSFPNNEAKAISLYECNISLAESCYPSLSVFEVTLRNAINRELVTMAGRDDWYVTFANIPGLKNLNRYITQASKQIAGRHETITPSKIVAELTLGFWVSLFNSEYERILWKHLRRAFPYMPKPIKQRKNISAPLNNFRRFRNRVFHNESICWNLNAARDIHANIILIIGWMNKDIPAWLSNLDRFDSVCNNVQTKIWGTTS